MFLLLASLLSPFFVEFTPEVRTTYQSLGKIVEDRPMEINSLRFGWDSGLFGRFGARHWEVSSLTDRRADVHRHALYHTEWGATWQYDWKFADGWTLKNDLTRSWTIYRGFDNEDSNKTYHWWQIDQSLENSYVVPFYRLRRAFITNDYLYFKAGLRRRFVVWRELSITPSVFVEGGNGRNFKRAFGRNVNGGGWGAGGVGSVSFRLEAGWTFNEWLSAFAAVEQYVAVGEDVRDTNAASSNACTHNDWTHGAVGFRLRF